MQEESTVSDKISFLYESFYQQYLQDNYPDYKERQQDIERLIEVALRYNSLEHFLSDLTVNEDVQNNVSKGQKITLTTVHQAKGLEWDVVFVISVNPGDFPSYYALMENNIDEEERIFYVAITRPRKLLYLVTQQYPSSPYMYWAKAVDFLQKIPEELVDIYDTSY